MDEPETAEVFRAIQTSRQMRRATLRRTIRYLAELRCGLTGRGTTSILVN